MENKFVINNRQIGPELSTYVIAEISANHNQEYERAVEIINAAAVAGADAIKVQTYTPGTLTIDCDKEIFRIKGTIWDGRKLYDLYKEAYMPWEWQPKLKQVAHDLGLDFFSTAYDKTAVDFLESMDVPVYKIASFELVDLPLLRLVAQTGKPIILSTGMATLDEINEAVQTIREAGGEQLALLKCTSVYPAPPDEMNLLTIPHLAETFGVPTGISDHTLGILIPVISVSNGACIVEKHFTISRRDPGPDSEFSLEPDEFRQMVEAIRMTEKALGEVKYQATDREQSSKVFRRSLFVVEDIKEGEKFSQQNIRAIRPGNGLHTRFMDEIIGLSATRTISRGTPLSWDYINKQ